MTDAEVEALATAARAATPGEWLPLGGGDIYVEEGGHKRLIAGTYIYNRSVNAEHISRSHPAAVLRLIARLRDAEADAARFRHIIAGAEHFPDPEPRPEKPAAWGWSIQWGCWTAEGTDIRAAIDAAMKDRGSPPPNHCRDFAR